MKFIQKLMRAWSELKDHYYQAREKKRNYQLECLSCESINVMEYDGNLYIAHNGVPIVRTDRLNIEATQLVVEARKDYLSWKSKFNK